MEKINVLDPEAIVVVQGDHGWYVKSEDYGGYNDIENILIQGKIFNAIKAPDSCFEKYGEPKTNVNAVRFALNCAYGFNLPFRKDIHYRGFYHDQPEYGSFFEQQIY